MKNRPIIGISMGDPSGIGPEIAIKALARSDVYEICRPLIIGDGGAIKEAVRIVGSDLEIHPVIDVTTALFTYGAVDIIDLHNVNLDKLNYGQVSAMAGNAAFEAVKKLIELAMAKQIEATITGPINKEALNLAGHHFSGHTEIFAHYTNTSDYTMMLVHENVRIAHVSTHVSLRDACDLVQKDRVLKVIKLADEACKKFGISAPKIGVAGLNPHSSENSLFGWEEKREITPAIEEALQLGINVEGPVPPDSLFPKVRGGLYDIAVAMYHDQGHIPLKTLSFKWNKEEKKWDAISGVNITLGLPIIRSSVDHGTAFSEAGKGTASELSMIGAIDYGVRMAGGKGLK